MNTRFATLRTLYERLHDDQRTAATDHDLAEPAERTEMPTLRTAGNQTRHGRGRYRRRSHHRDAV